MLQDFQEQLCKELDLRIVPGQLTIGECAIAVKDLNPGLSLHARICPCPEKKREALFIYLMRANLLGQGTGGARIGLDPEEKFLTLSLGLPYEMNYQSFKETVEDFANYLLHWRGEVAKFEKEV